MCCVLRLVRCDCCCTNVIPVGDWVNNCQTTPGFDYSHATDVYLQVMYMYLYCISLDLVLMSDLVLAYSHWKTAICVIFQTKTTLSQFRVRSKWISGRKVFLHLFSVLLIRNPVENVHFKQEWRAKISRSFCLWLGGVTVVVVYR